MSIKTWQERVKPEYHDIKIARDFMQAEIDELRAALAERDAEIERLKGTLQDVRGHYERVCKERDALKDVCAKLLANADWRVGGVLTPTSKRSDFQSSGYSIVKTRDLASVRDALGEKS